MTMPVYYISHGGGPWPWMPEAAERYAILTAALQDIPNQLPRKPKAIVMVSAHWEADGGFLIMGNPKPPMYYDYYNFPPHTYEVQYPASGSPELARQVVGLLEKADLTCAVDTERGFDHGTFVPLAIMYPDADIPVVQVSLETHFDPELHLALGRALAPLRNEDILIIGSGLSYHNLREIRTIGSEPSAQFDAWLQQVVVEGPVAERSNALKQWETAPAARRAHPREDHLLPLMVAVGAAENEAATCVHHEVTAFANITASSFRFG
ncbi:DODA-type extradiol aromatic ring-opening family dioxygenase [Pusillimonas minor]|uniref:Dioxygenase n=1 Tax=Pusillimonas minor TaxID=2697024 RepID=A0A842HR51_9BURK|nr:class III extradiol ring-cleavage dioxygenase [Pusillimonas minor]MBC2770098.1 dioxygenase [Pusillimonas minor]